MSDIPASEGYADEHQARFRTLPPAGTPLYWQRIETNDAQQVLPPEVLALCIRERAAAGDLTAAQRLFATLVDRITDRVPHVVRRITVSDWQLKQLGLLDDVVQEAYIQIWLTLTGDRVNYFGVNFGVALLRACQHAAQTRREQEGITSRSDHPTRVPRHQVESVEQDVPQPDGTLAPRQFADPASLTPHEQVERADELRSLMEAATPEQRDLLYRLFCEGVPTTEIAARLGITDRAVRVRRANAIKRLQDEQQRQEEADHGAS